MPGRLVGVSSAGECELADMSARPEELGGEPVPASGELPDSAKANVGANGFGVYVHVPFCASRCGYCDFNTYAPGEGADRDGYVDAVLAEIDLAARVLDAPPARVDTVFVGGGTPTLLPPADLGRILERIDKTWGLAAGAEITTEANPESVDPVSLRALRAAGFTRISLGMQSVAPAVLRVLDRQHTAGRAPAAAIEAREAGFEHVNLDLIYGTPGETADDFAASLDAVIGSGCRSCQRVRVDRRRRHPHGGSDAAGRASVPI